MNWNTISGGLFCSLSNSDGLYDGAGSLRACLQSFQAVPNFPIKEIGAHRHPERHTSLSLRIHLPSSEIGNRSRRVSKLCTRQLLWRVDEWGGGKVVLRL